MSCRAFGGGLLFGALLGSTSWWRYSSVESPSTQHILAMEGVRPLALDGTAPETAPTDLVLKPPVSHHVATEAVEQRPTLSHKPRRRGQLTASAQRTPPSIDEYRSVGKLRALEGVLDIAQPGNARRIVQQRSYKRELIMFTSDHQMGGWAYHWVNQMRQRGYEHWLILGDKASTCSVLMQGWAPMVSQFGELPLSCAAAREPIELIPHYLPSDGLRRLDASHRAGEEESRRSEALPDSSLPPSYGLMPTAQADLGRGPGAGASTRPTPSLTQDGNNGAVATLCTTCTSCGPPVGG